jgi:serine/threonine-protein kinase
MGSLKLALALASLGTGVAMVSCGGDDGSEGATGGAAPRSNGGSATTAGRGAGGPGGTTQGGAVNAASGSANGGTRPSGGGGASDGGALVGGTSLGGASHAGTSNGGAANGGASHAGTSTGGAANGGSSGASGSGGASAAEMTPFPATAPFYQDISKATLDDESTTIIDALDAIGWGDAGKRTQIGIDFSFNINLADGGVPRRAFTKAAGYYSPDCDFAPVPLPPGGKGEGVDNYACNVASEDCHLLVYQGSRYYELYKSNISGGAATGGTFTSMCEVIWDLKKDYWVASAPPNFSRGDGCTGADAANLPMAPLILTKADLMSGNIKHALRFTIDNNRIAADVYVHPATHFGGPTGDADMLPYGARLRLRGDYNLASLPNDHARTVAKALQTYGMYLADGGNIYISATIDASDLINNSILTALAPKDFEMIDGGERISGQDCSRTPITQ